MIKEKWVILVSNMREGLYQASAKLAQSAKEKILDLLEKHYMEKTDIDYIKISSNNCYLKDALASLEAMSLYLDITEIKLVEQETDFLNIDIRSKAGEIYSSK